MVSNYKDFIEMGKEYTLPNQQKSLWEQYLTGVQNEFTATAQQLQNQQNQSLNQISNEYAYDISSAYANYKKQQLSLQMNEQLGEGFRSDLGSQLQNEYSRIYQGLRQQEQSAYSKTQSEYASALASAKTQYDKTIKTAESKLIETAKTAKALEDAIFDFAQNTQNMDFATYSDDNKTILNPYGKLYTPTNAGGYGFYESTGVNDYGEATYELTAAGKMFFDKILHEAGTSEKFVQYLKDQDMEDLYNAYLEDPDFFNYVIGGLAYGDRSYSDEEHLKDLLQQVRDAYKK